MPEYERNLGRYKQRWEAECVQTGLKKYYFYVGGGGEGLVYFASE
jgi:hypothetical protein